MTKGRRVLCIAPHADDETLGCGGVLARHVKDGDDVTVAVVTGPGDGDHPVFQRSTWDVVREEAAQAMRVLGVQTLTFANVPAALVDDVPKHVLNKTVHGLIDAAKPEVMYVPHPYDLHKDHREIFHAASVAWRTTAPLGRGIREIYAYEVLSETHWNAGAIEGAFIPNAWFNITSTLDTKLRALACYGSQLRPFPDARSVEAAQALARTRGAQMSMEAAEAFAIVRVIG